MPDATKVIPLLPSEKTDKKEMMCGMAAVNESHSLFAVRKDRQKGNGWQMQQKPFPCCRQKRLTKRKWMADATKVSPFLPSEKTGKKEMMCGMATAKKVIPLSPSEKIDKKEMI